MSNSFIAITLLLKDLPRSEILKVRTLATQALRQKEEEKEKEVFFIRDTYALETNCPLDDLCQQYLYCPPSYDACTNGDSVTTPEVSRAELDDELDEIARNIQFTARG